MKRRICAFFAECQSAPLMRRTPDSWGVKWAATLPWPRGLVHAHVRHGDKFTEMQLQGTAKYLNASYVLAQLQPLTTRPVLFVSTEDTAVLSEATAAVEKCKAPMV